MECVILGIKPEWLRIVAVRVTCSHSMLEAGVIASAMLVTSALETAREQPSAPWPAKCRKHAASDRLRALLADPLPPNGAPSLLLTELRSSAKSSTKRLGTAREHPAIVVSASHATPRCCPRNSSFSTASPAAGSWPGGAGPLTAGTPMSTSPSPTCTSSSGPCCDSGALRCWSEDTDSWPARCDCDCRSFSSL